MVQERTAGRTGPTDGPRLYTEGTVFPHPSLRKDTVDVDNFIADHQLYSRDYLESVHVKHVKPTKIHHIIAWWWHMIARTYVSLFTGSWLGGRVDPAEISLVMRILTFSAVGVGAGAAAATVEHIRAMLLGRSDNGWAHTFARQAENCRMHGKMVAMAVNPPFISRLAGLMIQIFVFFQMLFVYAFFSSVGHAYTGYRAEEQVANLTKAIEMIDRGRAPWLEGLRAPMVAESYYGLGRGASMRNVLVRMRADEACNQHICHVFCDLSPGQANPFIERVGQKSVDLLELCYEVNFPPCTVVRRVVEHLPLGLHASKRTTEVLRDPSTLFRLVPEDLAEQALKTAGLPFAPPAPAALLSRLANDIQLCVECDSVCGPASDVARQTAGRDHETKLYDALSKAGIAHWTEDALRSSGFIKTPDARLQVPIAINGRVVCWIDSKATFGDERTHTHQLREQFQRYVNRFGPGLVIYWHGYLSHLADEDHDVLVLDSFPPSETITMLPQLPLDSLETQSGLPALPQWDAGLQSGRIDEEKEVGRQEEEAVLSGVSRGDATEI